MVILLAVAVIASGCGADTDSGTPSTDGGSANVVIEVVQGGTVLAGFLLADLRDLPRVTVKYEDREQEGPTLQSVLAVAGVEGFETVKVDGFRQGRGVSSELTRAEIDDQVILVIDGQGEVNLASRLGQLVADVNRLTVE
jgi:hypothetical protein